MATAPVYREHTALILLGASEFPGLPDIGRNDHTSDALRESAAAFKKYVMQQSEQLGTIAENVLDLFDSPESPGAQTERIEEFLDQFVRGRRNPADPIGNAADFLNLIVLYVGHGLLVGEAWALALAVRHTKENTQASSSIRMTTLADIIKTHARFARKFIFLDCCFAGKALADWQPGDAAAALTQVLGNKAGTAFDAQRLDAAEKALKSDADPPPSRGTALICAAGKDDVARATHPDGLTLFTGALLEGLRTSRPPAKVSLQDICDRTWHCIKATSGHRVRPQIYSTDQREGDIARYAFFPEYRPSHMAAALGEGRPHAAPMRGSQDRTPEGTEASSRPVSSQSSSPAACPAPFGQLRHELHAESVPPKTGWNQGSKPRHAPQKKTEAESERNLDNGRDGAARIRSFRQEGQATGQSTAPFSPARHRNRGPLFNSPQPLLFSISLLATIIASFAGHGAYFFFVPLATTALVATFVRNFVVAVLLSTAVSYICFVLIGLLTNEQELRELLGLKVVVLASAFIESLIWKLLIEVIFFELIHPVYNFIKRTLLRKRNR